MTALSILALGFFLGLRHATDADHVAAVSSIVARARSVAAAARIGVLWGVGHSATLLLVGGALVVMRFELPPRLGLSMEFSVAIMLILLGFFNVSAGARALRAAAAGRAAEGPAVETVLSPRWPTLRPVAIGLVHGLAGSAAVALLVLATLPTRGAAFAYLALFGFGTLAGMVALTVSMALPLQYAARRYTLLHPLVASATGLASVALGAWLAWDLGVVQGLFGPAPTWSPR